jgi:hypothetical protein
LFIASIDIAPMLIIAMLYAQTSSLSKVTAILVGASISSAVFLTKIGKSRACSMLLASFKTTSDMNGNFFQ